MARVSVVIPTYNRERWILASVESVLAQTIGDFELIVVDDGSTDSSVEILAAVGDSRLRVISENHRGIEATMNTGLRAASGLYLARNDSDDLWQPHFLETLLPVLDASRDLGFVYGRAGIIDSEGHRSAGERGYPLKYPDDGFRSLLYADYTCAVTTVFRREALVAAGGFNESCLSDGDWDVALRVARARPISYVDREVALVRHHGGNFSTPTAARHRQRLISRRQVIDRIFTDPEPSPDLRGLRSVAYRNLAVGEAMQHFQNGDIPSALRALRRGMEEGGSVLRTSLRIVWVMLSWLLIARFRWSTRLARRCAAIVRR